MFKRIQTILFGAVLLVTLSQGGCAPQAQPPLLPAQQSINPVVKKSLSETLVDFILSVVSKKSKKVDESLVRDEI